MWTMHIRTHEREDDVNRATREVITPGLVKVAERFAAEDFGAFFDGGVLLVFARASLLDLRAEAGCDALLDLHAAEVDAAGGFGPGLEVGDPGLVFVDGAGGVEFPEGDL